MINFDIEKNENIFISIEQKKYNYNEEAYLITLKSNGNAPLNNIKLLHSIPCGEITSVWNCDNKSGSFRGFHYKCNLLSDEVNGFPVCMFLDSDENNRYTVVNSDALNPCWYSATIIEETAKIKFSIQLLHDIDIALFEYKTTIYINKEKKHFSELLQNTIHKYFEYKYYDLPPFANEPVYSTWYSFHQELNTVELLKQCITAYELGCGTVIIDDGWQTENNERGYAYCGDWKLCKSKISSMKKLADEIHKLNMKILVWFSVPFVGIHSKAFKKFKNMLLDYDGKRDYYTLDPRYFEVREYLTDLYANYLKEWNIDGFKLDFIDSFKITEHSEKNVNSLSINKAIDLLLNEIFNKLKAINKDVLIEFRQSYIGPSVSRYANMIRVCDCPMDTLFNKINTIDLRMVCQNSAIHSDMLMWDYNSSVITAARQMTAVLFSVPQISVKIDKLSPEHYKMLKFYLKFWTENKDALINGTLRPYNAVHNYTMVKAFNNKRCVTVLYAEQIVVLDKDYKLQSVVNVTSKDEIVIVSDVDDICGTTYDCMGNATELIQIREGINILSVKQCGILVIELS